MPFFWECSRVRMRAFSQKRDRIIYTCNAYNFRCWCAHGTNVRPTGTSTAASRSWTSTNCRHHRLDSLPQSIIRISLLVPSSSRSQSYDLSSGALHLPYRQSCPPGPYIYGNREYSRCTVDLQRTTIVLSLDRACPKHYYHPKRL